MCGIPIKELQGNKGICQPGSPRKVRDTWGFHFLNQISGMAPATQFAVITFFNCNATIENLQGFTVALTGTAATDEVVGYGAIVSQDSSLVNCGDYIQLVTQSSQVQYNTSHIVLSYLYFAL